MAAASRAWSRGRRAATTPQRWSTTRATTATWVVTSAWSRTRERSTRRRKPPPSQPKEETPMSKKDFILIAAVIANTRNIEATSRALYAESFADALATTNPRFDRERFITACLKEG